MSDTMKDDPSVIKVRGLPYDTSAIDLCRFFKDCDIIGGPNGIYFCLNNRGLPTGEAFIEMERQEDVDRALERHKDMMGKRYVEVFESRQSVMDKVKRTTDRDRSPGAGRRGGRGGGGGSGGISQYCVKLRGLPWSATKEDVQDFLSRTHIVGGLRGIFITTDDRGRASGDAYVEVESSEDLELALKMHKRDMGSRYIEVFEANPLDVAQAQERERGGGRGRDRRERRSHGYSVQLRGLPYRASEREIADWLSEAAEPEDVIINMDRTGRPSGTAEAIFRDARDARKVADVMHKRDMGSRYIECFFDED